MCSPLRGIRTMSSPENGESPELWTEVNLVPRRVMDPALLDAVDGLVHGELSAQIETWFFLWEPELRLRIRWRDADHAEDHRRALTAVLDEWRKRRKIGGWFEGAHGARGERYRGEADHYGEEVWFRIQKDWMNGSELALLLNRLERAGSLTKPPAYHWGRHVHLFTNQLFGTWEAEIELCLRQALGYSKLRGGAPTPEAKSLLEGLNELLSD